MQKRRIFIAAAAGYIIALITSPLIPEFVSLLIPVIFVIVSSMLPVSRRNRINLDGPVLPVMDNPNLKDHTHEHRSDIQPSRHSEHVRHAEPRTGEFAQVVEYVEVLEDMVISEGRKDALDNEIVEKSLALFARLQRVIPLLEELNNADVNHTVRRLILKDLNGFINPFLRLSGEAKRNNRRMLLNGLKDVDSKISDIVSTIEHKDLMELQSKAELIHRRYNSSEL